MSIATSKNQFVALRFNLTGATDLVVFDHLRACRDTPGAWQQTIGAVEGAIADGKFALWAVSPGSTVFAVGGDYLAASIGPVKLTSPTTSTWDNCGGINGGNSPASGLPGAFTTIGIAMAPRGTYDFQATWTKGVASYDLFVGNATALRKEDFSNGGYVRFGPLLTVGAGGALNEHATTANGSIGFFNPGQSAALSINKCTFDDEACPPRDDLGYHTLSKSVGGNWDFSIAADVTTGPPGFVLGLAELPDSHYFD